jgi:hypothetical protein
LLDKAASVIEHSVREQKEEEQTRLNCSLLNKNSFGCSIEDEKHNDRQACGENSAGVAWRFAGIDGGVRIRKVKCAADS